MSLGYTNTPSLSLKASNFSDSQFWEFVSLKEKKALFQKINDDRKFCFGYGERLTKKQRRRACEFLIWRDGSKCQICEKEDLPDVYRCAVDHINGNKRDHRAVNMRRASHSCNNGNAFYQKQANSNTDTAYTAPVRERKKTGRSAPRDATETLHKAVNYQDGPVESQINDNCELDFRDWERAYINAHGSILRREAINSGAEKFGCSTMATRRYQDKLDSDAGPFRKLKDTESRKMIVVSRQQDNNTFL